MLTKYIVCTLIISLVTAIIFGIDKLKSKNRRAVRTPESVLLTLIALGGAFGGVTGLYVFRHKSDFTKKFQFAIGLWFSLILQIGVGVFLALVEYGVVNIVF